MAECSLSVALTQRVDQSVQWTRPRALLQIHTRYDKFPHRFILSLFGR